MRSNTAGLIALHVLCVRECNRSSIHTYKDAWVLHMYVRIYIEIRKKIMYVLHTYIQHTHLIHEGRGHQVLLDPVTQKQRLENSNKAIDT